MTLVQHELKQSRISLIVWTLSIASLLAVCVFLYPSMKNEMDAVSEMFSSMGSFTAAFGMDKVSFGTLTGFYVVECGNIVGLGGAFFAALCGISVLAKEEKEHTAEFLMTHPVSRWRVVTDKLIAVIFQLVILNVAVYLTAVVSIALIGEDIPWKELNLLHLAYFFLQVETATVCFGISAFLRRSGMGIGLGIAMLFYFLNLVASITEEADFLKYITPFGYAEGADIVNSLSVNGEMLAVGVAFTVAGIVISYVKYCKKDLR